MSTWTPYAPGNQKASLRRARTGTVLASHREELANSSGEINASNKKELAQAISLMARLAQQGDVEQQQASSNVVTSAVQRQKVTAQLQMLRESRNNPAAEQVIGEVIGQAIIETMGRESFSRARLQFQPVAQGADAKWRQKKMDVRAYQISSSGQVAVSEVRDRFVYPSMYQIQARILIEDKELELADSGLMDEKYQEGLQQIWRTEDLYFIRLAREIAPSYNDVVQFANFNPTAFSTLRTNILQQSLPVAECILAMDMWDDIIAGSDFSTWWDEVSRHDLITTGRLGSILGVPIRTDGFRPPLLKVLNDGEVFMFSIPEALGGLAQHGEMTTAPINEYNIGNAKRGWFFNLMESMVLLNGRSVSRGFRV